MSDLITAARPYARAVFELAQSESSFAVWSDALGLMSALVTHANMREMLDSPKIGADKKAQLLIDVCDGKLKPAQQNLLRMLAENGRFALLPDISALYEMMRAEAESKIEAKVKSAHPLSDAQQQSIIAALKKKLGRDITLVTEIDATLIGGVVIRAGDLVIDGSAQAKLASLGQALSH
ncbi:MAG: F0F1 ATP synthase subunit delta [Gammaproteobacteria bacterium]|jgi:F-type H+-transporting ATPase subunit delta|nr:F0F1 ATP synthase subunit delta [Gammaproteobacteria bacterium]